MQLNKKVGTRLLLHRRGNLDVFLKREEKKRPTTVTSPQGEYRKNEARTVARCESRERSRIVSMKKKNLL